MKSYVVFDTTTLRPKRQVSCDEDIIDDQFGAGEHAVSISDVGDWKSLLLSVGGGIQVAGE